MRIISVRPAPVAGIFALIYALCGLQAFIHYALGSFQTFTLPIGLIMGIFHENVNINLRRSPDLIANVLLCAESVFSYALSGWISGLVLVLCFNFFAGITGGIDAKFVAVYEDAPATIPSAD